MASATPPTPHDLRARTEDELLALVAGARRWWPAAPAASDANDATLPARVVVLPPVARVVAAALRVFARGSLLVMAVLFAFGEGPSQANTFAHIRSFATFFLAPEAAAWLVLRAFAARATIDQGMLVLARGGQRLQLALNDIAAVVPWRLPLPVAGATLRLASGKLWPYQLALADPLRLARALQAAGASLPEVPPSAATSYLRARLATPRSRLDHPVAKFVLLPMLLAIPAFRLHQHIAYGSSFGELHAFGAVAFAKGFALWWAAWAIGVVLAAAVLRALIELATLAVVLVRPAAAVNARRWCERLGHVGLYGALPAWLVLRLLAG
jgi:apolipoprotein N-acyltransferase